MELTRTSASIIIKSMTSTMGWRFMNEKKIEIEENEYWYGGATYFAPQMPFSKDSDVCVRLTADNYFNQVSPTLFSDKGRFIYGKAFDFSFRDGQITLCYEGDEPIVESGYETLRGAYLAYRRKYAPPKGKRVPKAFFEKPQFNDWIEIGLMQNQADIERYAEGIERSGYPCGVFMIDDRWSDFYGKFSFSKERFPDPRAMIEKLHALGYKIMLWESPFVTADTEVFKELVKKNLLIKAANGEIAIRYWWNGYSALLDMTNPESVAWWEEQNAALLEMGIDGFKFDAGDEIYYRKDDITYAKATPSEQLQAYLDFGAKYEYNEFRAAYGKNGDTLVQRLADRYHAWDDSGLLSLVPSILAMGLEDYPYACPDMVGGGCLSSLGGNAAVDEELFVRYAQASALMPMMQFSRSPWKALSAENNARCLAMARLHSEFSEYIVSLAEHTANSGEPIARYLEYEFPKQGYAKTIDAFMLGDRYLVLPVLQKGVQERTFRLPLGANWKTADGCIYRGGTEVTLSAPIDVLPYLERV